MFKMNSHFELFIGLVELIFVLKAEHRHVGCWRQLQRALIRPAAQLLLGLLDAGKQFQRCRFLAFRFRLVRRC